MHYNIKIYHYLAVSGPVPDIMILLDKSADYLTDNAIKIKTIKFIKNFMLDMGNYRFTRFGLITFDEKDLCLVTFMS